MLRLLLQQTRPYHCWYEIAALSGVCQASVNDVPALHLVSVIQWTPNPFLFSSWGWPQMMASTRSNLRAVRTPEKPRVFGLACFPWKSAARRCWPEDALQAVRLCGDPSRQGLFVFPTRGARFGPPCTRPKWGSSGFTTRRAKTRRMPAAGRRYLARCWRCCICCHVLQTAMRHSKASTEDARDTDLLFLKLTFACALGPGRWMKFQAEGGAWMMPHPFGLKSTSRLNFQQRSR